MPAAFSKLGISFQYPDNWVLDEKDALAGRQSVTVYSPGGGFWSISIHPQSVDPQSLARAAVDAMKQEYGEVESEAVEETMAGRQLGGFDLKFYYLDLISTATVRCVRIDHATYAIFSQAEDRDFDDLGMVFRAITTSFLAGFDRLPGSCPPS
jgi:hypothetical protein